MNSMASGNEGGVSLQVDQTFVGQLRRDLEQAFSILSERCLYESAKWTAEALNGLDLEDGDNSVDDIDVMQDASVLRTQTSYSDESDVSVLDRMSGSERRKYTLAKACFDCREYDRATMFLDKCTSPKCIFLRLYSKYISGEKKKEEQSEVILGPLDGDSTPNKELALIIGELEQYFRSTDRLKHDPFLLYLYGVVLIKHKCEKAALEPLVRSVKLYPYNWGAWLELAACVSTIDQLPGILEQIPTAHIMTKMFEVVTSQELFQSTDAVFATLSQLETLFPSFQFLKVQRALLCYHALEYNESEKLFDLVLSVDPHRLDDMDMYSNILYVTEQKAKLAYLAQLASSTDKFRPETCCIIANYYSLKSEHEKAVVYYRRALTLNRNCLGAWTLMGHEYVELKNIRAAIESYRRAIGVNSKDVRAWYGLGQAYEVIEMYYYSFFYYQRAAALKPYDHRMWVALGNCFEKLQRPTEAIKAYKRALSLSEMDSSILQKLSSLHASVGDVASAARYSQLCKEADAQS
ncbi:anaphase promoting complex subunit 8 [Lipomyces orientalis]|uniref:Anaphase promoting complex subunit 8 n=1 Tax=Lipomyces orientalis TaxID=1233043 RepID=A0ACC3TE33_9ASCO